MRDEFGFIDIDKLEKENVIHLKPNRLISFFYNNKSYFYKKTKRVGDCYNELIAEEIAKELGLPVAHYDLATYDNEIGVLTERFYQQGDRLIYIEDILKACYKEEKEIELQNNLEDIWYALDRRYKDKMLVAKLISQLVSIFIFDILIANIDRHSANLIIVENKEGINFSKVFDNENMLNTISIHDGGYALGVDRDDYFRSECELKENFLSKFLSISSSFYKDLLKEKLEIISEENIEKILQKVEKRINTDINSYIRENIKKCFITNYETINKTLNPKIYNLERRILWKIK